MNRKSFLASTGVAIAGLLTPVFVKAEATPVASPSSQIGPEDFLPNSIEKPNAIVQRGFDDPSDGGFSDTPYWILGWGMKFSNQRAASTFAPAWANALQDWELSQGSSSTRPVLTAVKDLGDETWGWTFQSSYSRGDFTISIVAARKASLLQILAASADDSSAIATLSDAAAATMRRWPNDDRERMSGGLHVGGLWDVLPRLTDVPEGMTLTLDATAKI